MPGPSAAFGGVWNIVPTPFTPSGDLDIASVRRLTDFVIGTGVDGLTILGVMGEAPKLSDAERSGRHRDHGRGGRRATARVRRDQPPATDRAVAFACEAAALGAHSLMLAPRSSRSRPMRRSGATTWPSPRPRTCRSSSRTTRRRRASRCPSSSSRRSARRLPRAGRSSSRTSRHRPRWPRCAPREPRDRDPWRARRDHALRGAPRRRRGHDDRLRLPGGAHPDRHGFRAGDEDGARDVFYRYLPLIRFENQPGINLPLRKHVYRRRGAMASERARSPVAPLDAGTKQELDRDPAPPRPGRRARPDRRRRPSATVDRRNPAVRIALVGAGRIGQLHGRLVAEQPGSRSS